MNNFSELLVDSLKSLIIREGYVLKSPTEIRSCLINGDLNRKQFYVKRKVGENYFFTMQNDNGDAIGHMSNEQALEAFNEAIVNLKGINKELKFLALMCPYKGIQKLEFLNIDGISIRYIKDYQVMTDSLIERWDILIE